MIGRAGEAAAIARFVKRYRVARSGSWWRAGRHRQDDGRARGHREAREPRYQVLRARPAEAEADLSHAALRDLIGRNFDGVHDALPAPQRQALEVALLLRGADAPADPRTTASALLTVVTILSSRIRWSSRSTTRNGWTRVQARARVLSPAAAPAGGVVVAIGRSRRASWFDSPVRSAAAGGTSRPRAAVTRRAQPGRPEADPPHPLPATARPVAEASNGNPFYALEISGALAGGATQPAPGDPSPSRGRCRASSVIALLAFPPRRVPRVAAAAPPPSAKPQSRRRLRARR